MSIKWMTWVWQSSPYSGERLLLHLALADYANDEGVCFPSHHTLARKARCSTSWVSQTMRQMIKDNMIEVIERAGNGRGKVGRYRLTKGGTESDLSDDIGVTSTANRSHFDGSHTLLLNRHEPSHAFDMLWKAYPKKVAKGAAQRAFDRLMRQPDAPSIDVLIKAVERYASNIRDMQYCAHLATWLNGERWLLNVSILRSSQHKAWAVQWHTRADRVTNCYHRCHTERRQNKMPHLRSTR
jgi:hypothetical protein